jgi:predicted RNase H-like HicB family nuclease
MTDKYVALMELDRRTGKYGVVVPDVPGFSTSSGIMVGRGIHGKSVFWILTLAYRF